MIGRVALYSVLLIAVIIGLLDYRAKSAAIATSTHWAELTDRGQTVQRSELDASLEPGATILEPPKSPNDDKQPFVVEYRWNGMIRQYTVRVTYERRDPNPFVQSIAGLGE